MQKIKNHWREIILTADVNIGFNGIMICQRFKTKVDADKKKMEALDEKKMKNTDALDEIKSLSTLLEQLSKNLNKNVEDNVENNESKHKIQYIDEEME